MRTSKAGPVERILDILELLGSRPMAVEEIATALDLPGSSTYRLLRMLRDRHVVFQPPGNKTFQMGFAVLRWADAARRSLDLVGLARPSLQALAEKTQETTSLTLLHGDSAATADVIEGRGQVRVAPDRGRILPLYAGAACKAILAHLGEECLELSGASAARRGKALEALKADLEATRERGYALSAEEVYEGASAVAVPIFLGGSSVVGSLAVSAPLVRMNDLRKKQFAKLLKAEAARLNQLLDSASSTPARPRGSRAPSMAIS
jgi:DNA-binding IclR family transcriptional regulator